MMQWTKLLIVLFLSLQQVDAQLPSTQMHMFKLASEGKGIEVKEAWYLNGFNKSGYNNQMQFLDGLDKLVISSNAYYPDSTNDILLLDFTDLSLDRLTKTVESEYSPTPISMDEFTCIRVEKDGKDQGLWKYDINKNAAPIRLLEHLDNVGYHLWLDDERVILFLVDDPNYMAVAYPDDDSFKVLESNIGRCFKRINSNTFLYVHKISDAHWVLKSHNLQNGENTTIVRMPNGVEDFDLLQDNTLICGNNGYILIYDKQINQEEWLPYVDLSRFGLDNISRLVMKKNVLITVSE